VRINGQLVQVETPSDEDLELLRVWIAQHAQLAASGKAQALLEDWAEASKLFLKVVPKDQPAVALPVPVAIPAVAVSV
jgi:glutamate synthase domain-containing protein 3